MRARSVFGGVIFVGAIAAFAFGVTGDRGLDVLVAFGGLVLGVLVSATRAVCPSCGKNHWMMRGSLGHCMGCGAAFEPTEAEDQ